MLLTEVVLRILKHGCHHIVIQKMSWVPISEACAYAHRTRNFMGAMTPVAPMLTRPLLNEERIVDSKGGVIFVCRSSILP